MSKFSPPALGRLLTRLGLTPMKGLARDKLPGLSKELPFKIKKNICIYIYNYYKKNKC